MDELLRLNKAEQLERLAEIRSDKSRLLSLQQSISRYLSAPKCTVVGSAPGLIVPDRLLEFPIVCVNGSGFGIRERTKTASVTVIGGYITRGETANPKLVMEKIRGLSSELVVIVEIGDELSQTEESLARSGFHYGKLISLTRMERAAIVGLVLGEELGLGDNYTRISLGLFSIILAIWVGAPEIEICGFSLEGGHSYAHGLTPRLHIGGDTRCFELIRALRIKANTTSIELSERFGFRLSSGVRMSIER